LDYCWNFFDKVKPKKIKIQAKKIKTFFPQTSKFPDNSKFFSKTANFVGSDQYLFWNYEKPSKMSKNT